MRRAIEQRIKESSISKKLTKETNSSFSYSCRCPSRTNNILEFCHSLSSFRPSPSSLCWCFSFALHFSSPWWSTFPLNPCPCLLSSPSPILPTCLKNLIPDLKRFFFKKKTFVTLKGFLSLSLSPSGLPQVNGLSFWETFCNLFFS